MFVPKGFSELGRHGCLGGRVAYSGQILLKKAMLTISRAAEYPEIVFTNLTRVSPSCSVSKARAISSVIGVTAVAYDGHARSRTCSAATRLSSAP